MHAFERRGTAGHTASSVSTVYDARSEAEVAAPRTAPRTARVGCGVERL